MLLIAAFVFGAIVGSFLNVCILRLPKEESIVFPASHCFSCSKPIAWFDNIPLVSFFLLKGRCRHCSQKISWQYAAVEFLTACIFVLYTAYFGLTPQGIVYLILTLALVVETWIDFRHRIIPDEITLPGMALALVASAVFPGIHGESVWWAGFLKSLIGLLVGGGFLYIVGTVAERILKKEAMGGGDVKLLALIGAVIGWQGVLWTIFASSFVGAVVGLYYKWKRGEEAVPYGPFLALGAVSYLFFGQTGISWYMRLIGV